MSYQELNNLLLSIQNKAQMVCPINEDKKSLKTNLYEDILKYISYLERAIRQKAWLNAYYERMELDKGTFICINLWSFEIEYY